MSFDLSKCEKNSRIHYLETTTTGLDVVFTVEPEDGGFCYLIWTPDATGGVIGSGPTPQDAILDAIGNLAECASGLSRLKPPTHEEILNDQ